MFPLDSQGWLKEKSAETWNWQANLDADEYT